MFLPECPTGRRWRLPGGLRSPRLAALPVLLACAAALATALPFAFTHVGSFRHMSHTGDTAGQARLASLPQQPGTWGLGATAGLNLGTAVDGPPQPRSSTLARAWRSLAHSPNG